MELKTEKRSSFRLRSSPSLNALRLRRTFDLFDSNADGILTIHELNHALTRLGLDSSLSEIQSIIDSHIKPGLAGLQFDDFQSLHQNLDSAFFSTADVESDKVNTDDGDDEADLIEAFKVFDENGDGFISAMELEKVLKKLGLCEGSEIGTRKVEMMIGSVDRNRDGVVDFSEFKDMMRAVVVRSG